MMNLKTNNSEFLFFFLSFYRNRKNPLEIVKFSFFAKRKTNYYDDI